MTAQRTWLSAVVLAKGVGLAGVAIQHSILDQKLDTGNPPNRQAYLVARCSAGQLDLGRRKSNAAG
jgi:hypothetical protein